MPPIALQTLILFGYRLPVSRPQGEFVVHPDQLVFPRLRVVPMGWSHALDVAQNFLERLVCRALSIPRNLLLRDGAAPCEIDQGVPAFYAGNFWLFSSNQEAASKAFERAKSECVRLGLPTREEVEAQRFMEALGWHVDGEACQVAPTRRRA